MCPLKKEGKTFAALMQWYPKSYLPYRLCDELPETANFTLLGRWLVWNTEYIHSSWEVTCMEYRIHLLFLGSDLYGIQNTFTLLGR